MALKLAQHRQHLVGGQDLDLFGLDRGRGDDAGDVAIDELVLDCPV